MTTIRVPEVCLFTSVEKKSTETANSTFSKLSRKVKHAKMKLPLHLQQDNKALDWVKVATYMMGRPLVNL